MRTPIPPPNVPFLDVRTGIVDMAWYDYLLDLDRCSLFDPISKAVQTNGQTIRWIAATRLWTPGT